MTTYSKERNCEHVEIRLWSPGESEEGLWGFDTMEGRDADARGEPGPFWRRVRPAHLPPPSLEYQVTRAYLAGADMQQVLDTVRAEGTVQ
ncbi:hypothetical protein BAJUN_01440 [Bajunvirus bajun]|uniref:Uncharacterized protein n=1 Tax=Brevundimonas phage vB_BgoS-Bajun TaxID=2948594 RepID=A0A9E7N7G3_9CAUD|nr:hypothetical protein BAJUN_01440 [Brevundimonas phage vB_BgoS-Bajun]